MDDFDKTIAPRRDHAVNSDENDLTMPRATE